MTTETAGLDTALKEALQQLWDQDALQHSPLLDTVQLQQYTLSRLPHPTRDDYAHTLRELLQRALEMLKPGESTAQQTSQQRYYDALRWRYWDALPGDTVAARLNISRSTLYRDIDKALLQLSQAWLKLLADLPAGDQRLPAQPTAFIGREQELQRLVTYLQDPACRLITLVGLGGSGKTRLALQGAQLQNRAFPQGVYFFSLAAFPDYRGWLTDLADRFHIPAYTGATLSQAILRHLQNKRLLVVFDNFESLLPPPAAHPETIAPALQFLLALLENAPGVKLLVTSRLRLNLRWEWPLEVQGMRYPTSPTEPDWAVYDAVQLFVQRAQQAAPHRQITPTDAAAISHICHLLDGSPLGIELAAAWITTHTCEEIARRIAHAPTHLTSPYQDTPERQRSLAHVCEQTWQLLSPAEQQAFCQLAVFQGDFTAEAVRNVTGNSSETLAALQQKYLLQTNGVARYTMNAVLHTYAAEKLQQTPHLSRQLHERHSDYYLQLLCEQAHALKGPQQYIATATLTTESRNIQTAWHWAVANARLSQLERAMPALHHFYEIRGWFQAGIQTFTAAITLLETLSPTDPNAARLLSQALAYQGRFHFDLHHPQPARDLSLRSITLARRMHFHAELALPLKTLGNLRLEMAHHPQARRIFAKSLTIYQETGDDWGVARCLFDLGNVELRCGELEPARDYYQQSLRLFRQLHYPWGEAWACYNLGGLAETLGDYNEATAWLEQGRETFARLDCTPGIAWCLYGLGSVAILAADDALTYIMRSLSLFQRVEDQWGQGWCMVGLGRVAAKAQHYSEAQAHYHSGIAIFENIGYRRGIGRCQVELGLLLCELGEPEPARVCFTAAERIAQDMHDLPLQQALHFGAARLAVLTGDLPQVHALLQALLSQRGVAAALRSQAHQLLTSLP